ncbi:hypothetical protein [Curtobacterium flaccumfaciens]|uniref:hypothetical protein n=1 Tax=Curtobacterium flaccumfaciens TaxID=2035 RepID=UPI001E428D64|nr:hypothetical protein [Curtobacterium allii]MCE0459531.1 hypothetical protein [Curtobacterium allii]
MASIELNKPVEQQFQDLASLRAGLIEAQSVVITNQPNIYHTASITKGERTGKDTEVGPAWDALQEDPESGLIHSWQGGGGFEVVLSFDESLKVTGHVEGVDETVVNTIHAGVLKALTKAA